MGKRVDRKTNINNMSACNDYIMENSDYGEKQVIAKKGSEVLFNDKVTVNFTKNNVYYNVNIIWDEKNIEYHELGLNGYYSSMFCEMRYNNGLLQIDDGILKIEIHE